MCAMAARAWACSGLQVFTTQALSPVLCGNHDGWAQEQVACILNPVWAAAPPLSSAAFKASVQLLHTDLVTQHAVSQARELAQHANQEAHEDCCDAPQTIQGRFGTAKLKEVLCLLNLASAHDLLEVLHSFRWNKKKSDDALILQMAINN